MYSPAFGLHGFMRGHGKELSRHSLTRALTSMWLELGIHQGKVAKGERSKRGQGQLSKDTLPWKEPSNVAALDGQGAVDNTAHDDETQQILSESQQMQSIHQSEKRDASKGRTYTHKEVGKERGIARRGKKHGSKKKNSLQQK